MTVPAPKALAWLDPAASLVTPRRIRSHAAVLALCLWGVCLFDFSTPGLFDRAGNVKFQDFLQFPISAHLIVSGRARDLYNDQVLAESIHAIVPQSHIYLQYFYGPQVALLFVPLNHFSFLAQALIWSAISLLVYFGCILLLAKKWPRLQHRYRLIALCGLAYPPLFHFFVRGHISALIVLCFTAAALAFLNGRTFAAGIALGFLVFKPQFLLAIPLLLLFANSWAILIAVTLSAAAQLAFATLYFGPAVMRAYFSMLLHSATHPGGTELLYSPVQMHSLRSFFTLLIPWPHFELGLYVIMSLGVIGGAAVIWRSQSHPEIRFSALILASVLVNPHIYIYDLVALCPVFLLLADWTLDHANHPCTPALRVLLYLAFLLPLFGPLAWWTHIQISVVVFLALLWVLWEIARTAPDELDTSRAVVV